MNECLYTDKERIRGKKGKLKERVYTDDHPCRYCLKIAPHGFYKSRAIRFDWICPRAHNKKIAEQRRAKRNIRKIRP